MQRYIFFIVLSGLFSLKIFAANPEPQVDQLFANYDLPDSPGYVVGVYQKGKPIYVNSYGMADLELGVKLDTNSRFIIASVSKQFAAFAIALLAEEGRLDLDADIRTYIPRVPDFGHTITVRQLVHHTSGLRDHVRLLPMAGVYEFDHLSNESVMRLVERQTGLNFEPGTAYTYCNTGYMLLAEIVSAVTGKSLRDFTSERMFKPLGMEHTFFYDDVAEIVPERARPYRKKPDGSWIRDVVNSEVTGSTGLMTNIHDFLKWIRNFGHPVVGSPEVMKLITSSGVLKDGTKTDYGFGLELKDVIGRKAIRHSGSYWGYKADFAYFPDDDFGVAIMTNTGNFTGDLIEKITEIYLGAPEKKKINPLAEVTLAVGVLSNMTGRYIFSDDKAVDLELTSDGLVWKWYGATPRPVVFLEDGTFGLHRKWGPQFSEFYRPHFDHTGNMIGFTEVNKGWDGRLAAYQRVAEVGLSQLDIAEVAGSYYSDELDTTYTVSAENGTLFMRSRRIYKDIVLKPVAKDRFDTNDGPITTLVFERDKKGHVKGFYASAFRVSGIWASKSE